MNLNGRNISFLRSALPDEEELPTEFRIFAFGVNDSMKGPALFDAEAARLVMAEYATHGTELMFDYEHQVLADPPVEAPAAGWFKLEVRGDGSDPADGLFAIDIRWTEKAAGYLRAKEYRYFSPAFFPDKDGRVTGLLNVALTNTPATHGLTPLVAASRAFDGRVQTRAVLSLGDVVDLIRIEINRMPSLRDDWVYVCDVFDTWAVFERNGHYFRVDFTLDGTTVTITSEPQEVVRSYSPVADAPGETPDMKQFFKALGLPDTATEADALAALADLQKREEVTALNQVLTLTGKQTNSEALGTVQAWKQASEQVTALSARVTELEGEKLEAEVAALVKAGRESGQITPALEAWALDTGRKDVEQLKAYLASAPKVVALNSQSKEPKPEPTTVKKWSELKPMEKHRLHASDPDTYEALKAEFEAEARSA